MSQHTTPKPENPDSQRIEDERRKRREAVQRFLEWRKKSGGINMTIEEILEARHEGHKY